jgi:hypothetical protein
MDIMAKNFPGAFSGYSLRVVESHQSSKKDTSGTAKAVVKSFQGLGLDFDDSQIELVREPLEQVCIRVQQNEGAIPFYDRRFPFSRLHHQTLFVSSCRSIE